jgi:hypothetical protein
MATRAIREIKITFDPIGEPAFVIVQAKIDGDAGLLSISETRGYSVAFQDLGVGAQSKVTDFVAAVAAWLNNHEPMA